MGVSSKDEIGRIASAFNEMAAGLEKMRAANYISAPAGVAALEACCLGIPLWTWPGEDNWAQYAAIVELSHEERFQVIDGKGANRVAAAIKSALQNRPRTTNGT